MVIEKVSEDEGFGSWALKKLEIARIRSSNRNEYDDEIEWNDSAIELHSYNSSISPSRLDPNVFAVYSCDASGAPMFIAVHRFVGRSCGDPR